MAEKQETKQHAERESAWRALLSRVSRWPERQAHMDTWREKGDWVDEPHTSDVVHDLIGTLAPTRPCMVSQAHDLEAMQRALSLFRDAAQKGLITDDEALAVMQFVVARFVERRFNCILSDVFAVESGHKYTFRKIAGRLRRERESELAR